MRTDIFNFLSRPLQRAVLALICCATAGVAHAQTANGVPVYAVTPSVQTIYRQIEITGSVTSPFTAELSPETSGLVEQLFADAGDRVADGARLLALNDELSRHSLDAANARVNQAELAMRDAQRRLEEAEYLGPKGGIAQTMIEDLRAEVEQDRAALAELRADAGRQQALLDRHVLKAPFTGVISRRDAQPGQWIAPGQTAFELVSLTDLRVDFAVAESFLADIGNGSEVKLSIDALPEAPFDAHIKTIVPVTDPGARTFMVRVVTDQPVDGMMPGMSARAHVLTPTRRSGIAIPRDALLRHPDGRSVVWTVGGDNTAVEKIVETGESFDGLIEIRSGLESSEQVIARGNENLRPGQTLHLTDALGND